MNLKIVSPEATLFSGEVASVTVQGTEGTFQMLDYHADIISILTAGNIRIVTSDFIPNEDFVAKFTKENGQEYLLFIPSGIIEMKDNKIIILVD